MSIVRLIAVDPRPRIGEGDVVVYQVPEHSREIELLIELFSEHGIEHTVLETARKKPKGEPA